MSLSDFLTARHKLTCGLIAAMLLVASWMIYRQFYAPPRGVETRAWYYDLNTGRLFVAPINTIPPISAPSGPRPDGTPAGVRAHVYTCGTCAEPERKIVYLETRTLESQQLLKAEQQRPFGMPPTEEMLAAQKGAGVLVKRITDSDWQEYQDPEVHLQILDALTQLCPGNPNPTPCPPARR